ncbi:MAG: hypothetical protein ACR2GL_04955 [Thermoleophilaceae bacterium]
MDPRVAGATEAQLQQWRAELEGGAERVGWKIGFSTQASQQQAGLSAPVVGHVTSATVVHYGAHLSLAGGTRVMVEPEVAIEVGEKLEAVALAAAIEVIDVDRPFLEIEQIVETNIFHRHVMFGDFRPGYPPPRTAALLVNGQDRERDAVEGFDPAATIALVAETLALTGESLQPGDKIIAGALLPAVEVTPGDLVGVQLDNLGMVQLIFKE